MIFCRFMCWWKFRAKNTRVRYIIYRISCEICFDFWFSFKISNHKTCSIVFCRARSVMLFCMIKWYTTSVDVKSLYTNNIASPNIWGLFYTAWGYNYLEQKQKDFSSLWQKIWPFVFSWWLIHWKNFLKIHRMENVYGPLLEIEWIFGYP
jgi:hypothetical protein